MVATDTYNASDSLVWIEGSEPPKDRLVWIRGRISFEEDVEEEACICVSDPFCLKARWNEQWQNWHDETGMSVRLTVSDKLFIHAWTEVDNAPVVPLPPQRLSLPWPAWHTDEYGARFGHVTDEELVCKSEQHSDFQFALLGAFRPWSECVKEYDASERVRERIDGEMILRFRLGVDARKASPNPEEPGIHEWLHKFEFADRESRNNAVEALIDCLGPNGNVFTGDRRMPKAYLVAGPEAGRQAELATGLLKIHAGAPVVPICLSGSFLNPTQVLAQACAVGYLCLHNRSKNKVSVEILNFLVQPHHSYRPLHSQKHVTVKNSCLIFLISDAEIHSEDLLRRVKLIRLAAPAVAGRTGV